VNPSKLSKCLQRLALVQLFVVFSVFAQSGRPDTSFNPPSFQNYLSIWAKNDGRLVVLAPDTQSTNHYAKKLVRLNDSGAIDTTFKPALPTDFTLITAAQDANERIVIAGRFNSEPGTGRMTRLQADGSLDDSFQVTIDIKSDLDWSLGLLPASDSSIWVRGEFTNIGGQLRLGLGHINSSGIVSPFQFGTNSTFILKMATDGENLIALSAYFPPGSDAAEAKLYRAFADGTIDPAFVPDHVFNLNGLLVDSSRRILIAAVDVTPPDKRVILWRLLPNGSIDPTFHKVTSADGDIGSMALQPDGKILVGGTFRTLDGIFRRSVARLHPDGTIDLTFDPGEWGDWRLMEAYQLNLRPDGRYVVASWVSFSSTASLHRFWGDQNLHFRDLTLNAAGLASFSFANTIDSAWVLEASSDLRQWEVVRTNEITASRFEESSPSTQRFFRGVIR
jgi:uncharacterized delta-60 repeat protein